MALLIQTEVGRDGDNKLKAFLLEAPIYQP